MALAAIRGNELLFPHEFAATQAAKSYDLPINLNIKKRPKP